MNSQTLIAAVLGVALAAPVLVSRLTGDPALPPMESPTIPGSDAILMDALARACQLSPAQLRALGEPCAGDCPTADPSTERCIDETLLRELRQSDPLVGMWAVEAAIQRGSAMTAGAEKLATDRRAPSPAQARALVVLAWTLPREEAVAELRRALGADAPTALVAALELGRLRAAEAEPELRALEDRLERPADKALVAYSRALISGPIQATLQPSGI